MIDSTQVHISLSLAFHHCWSTGSYKLWLLIVVIVAVLGGLLVNYFGKKFNKDVATAQKVWWIAMAFAIMFAIFSRPTDVCQNTSLKAASQNQWLGY